MFKKEVINLKDHVVKKCSGCKAFNEAKLECSQMKQGQPDKGKCLRGFW